MGYRYYRISLISLTHFSVTVTAAVGLFLAPSPNFAHYIPFLKPLLTGETIAAGIATILAPAVAATFFVIVGIITIHCMWLLSFGASTGVV